MNRPRIFLSAVSAELHTVHQSAAATLHSLGFEPVWQEIKANASSEYLQWLRDKIDSCEGLLQIAGEAYGDEPSDIETEFGRVSYSQYELLYARSIGLTTWLIIAGNECPRDLPITQLDLPVDPNHPNPSSYQSERHQLQQDYLARLKIENHRCDTANSTIELQNIILTLEDELEELRDATERQPKLRFALVFAILCAILVLSVGYW